MMFQVCYGCIPAPREECTHGHALSVRKCILCGREFVGGCASGDFALRRKDAEVTGLPATVYVAMLPGLGPTFDTNKPKADYDGPEWHEYVPLEPAQVDADEPLHCYACDQYGDPSGAAQDEDGCPGIRSRPAVVDAEVMAVVKELDELRRLSLTEYALRGRNLFQHNAYVDALVEHYPTLSAALRSGRTRP